MERRGRRGCALKEASYHNDAVDGAVRVGIMCERVKIK
jgi:hypothetical protein